MMIDFANDTRMIWDFRVALDQFLGALGAGLLLTSLLVRRHRRTARIAATLAPVAVVTGIWVLMLKLGNPLALPHLAAGNTASLLFLGMLVQGAFVVVSVLYALALHPRAEKIPLGERVRRLSMPLGVAGAVMAVLVAVYHGMLLSDLIARPAWNNPILPVISLVSALTSGMAAAMIISLRVKDETDGVAAALMPSFKWLMGGQLVMLFSMGIQFSLSTPQPLAAGGGSVISGSVLYWLGAITLGTLVPVAASFASAIDLRRKGAMIYGLVLVGALTYRFVILEAGSASVVFNLPMTLLP
jgi:formate-dependent nitrite reductase membrane component NrfD